MSLIELHNISFAYSPEEPNVFEGLSLNIDEGKCLVVKGDNGSGKTTLFRIINGLSFPTEGSYVFDNIEITREYLKDNVNSKRFHKRIGYLFQNPDIMLFNGKVYDEIAFGPRQMGLTDSEIDRRTRDCMELFGITGLADKAPYHLSGGQKKKVALAAVMSLNPDILILDEPFAGLDKKTWDFLAKFFPELKACGKTIIIATHDEEVASSLGDEILDLK